MLKRTGSNLNGDNLHTQLTFNYWQGRSVCSIACERLVKYYAVFQGLQHPTEPEYGILYMNIEVAIDVVDVISLLGQGIWGMGRSRARLLGLVRVPLLVRSTRDRLSSTTSC